MTVQQAEDWINANLSTGTDQDGTAVATFTHPATGCTVCGVDHGEQLVEQIPVSLLANEHHTKMENSHADALGNGAPVDTVADAVCSDAAAQTAGQDRFYWAATPNYP